MPFPDATGWVPAQMPTNATPPQVVLDLMGGTFDANRYSWDPYTNRLTDRTTGGSYDYNDLIASQGGSNLVTDLSAYNASGGQQGVVQLPAGATPYFGFGDSAQGYNAGLMPGSGTFVSTDPNEISAYQSHRGDVVNRGVATVGALVGGAALGGALGGGGAAGSTAADGLTGVTVGNAAPGAITALPGGVPSVNAAGLAAWGGGAGAIPAVASLPASIATPAAINSFTGGAGAAANALGSGGGGNPVSGVEGWLPYLTTGINALLGANAANQASDAEVNAMREAIAEQRRQYDTTRADWEPWMAAGRDALGQLADPGNFFTASPDYNFRRSEGTRDIQGSFAASGGARSGNALRALAEFNSNLASGEFGNWWNRQSGRAGLGTTGTNAVTNAGTNAASQTSNYLANAGGARAAGLWGQSAAVANGLNDAVTNWLYRRRAA